MQENSENMQEGISAESIRLSISPSQIAKSTFLYALETGYLEMDNSYSVCLENSNSFLLLLVLDGEGKLIYEDKEYQLNNDDLVLIDCKKYHKYYTINKYGWVILYLYFNGNSACNYYNLISRDMVPIFKVENLKVIASLLWQIVTLHRKYNIHAEHLTSLHITRILTEICMFRDNEAVFDAEFPVFINEVFHHIYHFYHEKITLDLLSQLYQVSKFHLAREFKRCSGTTIKDYLATIRINKAKLLLRYSNESIADIAEKVGFNCSSHFIKHFHKREHTTPLYYRKQWTR